VVEGFVAEESAKHGAISNQEQLTAVLTHFDKIYFAPGSFKLSDEELGKLKPGELEEMLYEKAVATYEAKEKLYGEPTMRELERVIMLRVVDEYWMDHIDAMDDLKQGVGLRAYGQHDPVTEYKEQGFEMFQATVTAIREETVRRLFLVHMKPTQEVKREKVAKETGTNAAAKGNVVKRQPVRNADKKVGPNDPCPCGSGKKYKKCCREKDIAAGRQQG